MTRLDLLLLLIVPAFLLSGCHTSRHDEYLKESRTTPDGYRVVYEGPEPWPAVAGTLDAAVLQGGIAMELKYGSPTASEFVKACRDELVFKLLTGLQHKTINGRETYYFQAGSQQAKGEYASGVVVIAWENVDDRASLIQHEVGHFFYGALFEHDPKGTPPLVVH